MLLEAGGPFEVFGRMYPVPDGFEPGCEVLCSIDADDQLTIRKGVGAEWTRNELHALFYLGATKPLFY